MVMAYDRYVAICHPLRYPSIISDQFVAKASAFIIARNALLLSPVPILSARLRYCGKNVIENCICANLSVSRLSCDNITVNRIYQSVAGWTLLGSDFILIFISYIFILRAVFKLKTEGAAVKALSTCGSHFILILFFSTILLVVVLTNVARKRVPMDILILLNILHHLIPPALNPVVYGVWTKEIKQGIQKLLQRGMWIYKTDLEFYLPFLLSDFSQAWAREKPDPGFFLCSCLAQERVGKRKKLIFLGQLLWSWAVTVKQFNLHNIHVATTTTTTSILHSIKKIWF